MSRIGIIGGGIAGIGAAYQLLKEGFNVLLFEANSTLGGTTSQSTITYPNGHQKTIDTLFHHYNPKAFPQFNQFLEELQLPTSEVEDTLSFLSHGGDSIGFIEKMQVQFKTKAPIETKLTNEIQQFTQQAYKLLRSGILRGKKAHEFLEQYGYSTEFQTLYFYPLVVGSVSLLHTNPKNIPIQDLIHHWFLNGLLKTPQEHQRSIVGGMHLYAPAFQEYFLKAGGYLFTQTRIIGITRESSCSLIKALSANNETLCFKVDHVVLACEAPDVLRLVEDINPKEKAIFSQFTQQKVHMCIHTDQSVLGPDSDKWGTVNFIAPQQENSQQGPSITFSPRLHPKNTVSKSDVFVSINPINPPAPEAILNESQVQCPSCDQLNQELAFQVSDIQGTQKTWYCGNYLNPPFLHEQGFISGLQAAIEIKKHEERQTKILNSIYKVESAESAAATAKPTGDPAPVDLLYLGKELYVSPHPKATHHAPLATITGIFCGQISLKLSSFNNQTHLPRAGSKIYLSFPDQPTQMFYSCSSHILRAPLWKNGELIVEYPRAVEKYRRRKFSRAPVVVDGKLTSPSSPKSHGIKTINISASGVYFQLTNPDSYDGPIALGEQTTVELYLHELDSIKLPSRITRLEAQTTQGLQTAQRMAVRFEKMALDTRAQLDLFIKDSNRRKYQRVPTLIPATLQLRDTRWNCTVNNLSGGGAFVSINENQVAIEPGQFGSFLLPLPEQGLIEIQVDVIRVQSHMTSSENSQTLIGLEFMNIPQTSRDRLMGIVQFLRRSGFSAQ